MHACILTVHGYTLYKARLDVIEIIPYPRLSEDLIKINMTQGAICILLLLQAVLMVTGQGSFALTLMHTVVHVIVAHFD